MNLTPVILVEQNIFNNRFIMPYPESIVKPLEITASLKDSAHNQNLAWRQIPRVDIQSGAGIKFWLVFPDMKIMKNMKIS